MAEGPVGRSVMPHISVILGSVMLGGFNQRNKEKKFGAFIVLPLLLGFRSCRVRSSGGPLYVLCYLSQGCDWEFVELHGAVYPFVALENRSCKILIGKKIDKIKILAFFPHFFLMAYCKYIVSATPYSYLIVSAQFKVCIMDWFSTSLFFV